MLCVEVMRKFYTSIYPDIPGQIPVQSQQNNVRATFK